MEAIVYRFGQVRDAFSQLARTSTGVAETTVGTALRRPDRTEARWANASKLDIRERLHSTNDSRPAIFGPHSMPRSRNIISVGRNAELVSLRQAVLESAGLSVFSTLDPSAAVSRMGFGNFGLLLLCYSLPGSVREHLARQFRDCCPHGRILAISNKQVDESMLYADAVVYGIEGAEALLDSVRTELAHGEDLRTAPPRPPSEEG